MRGGGDAGRNPLMAVAGHVGCGFCGAGGAGTREKLASGGWSSGLFSVATVIVVLVMARWHTVWCSAAGLGGVGRGREVIVVTPRRGVGDRWSARLASAGRPGSGGWAVRGSGRRCRHRLGSNRDGVHPRAGRARPDRARSAEAAATDTRRRRGRCARWVALMIVQAVSSELSLGLRFGIHLGSRHRRASR